MKNTLLLLLFFSVVSNAQNTNIRKSIDVFFEGLNLRDSMKIKSVCMPNFTLQTIEEKGIVSNFLQTSTTNFFKSLSLVPSKMSTEERILSYSFNVDGTMAIIWMPYEFYINEKLSHNGVNVFTMFKDSGFWKIVSVIDTRRMKSGLKY